MKLTVSGIGRLVRDPEITHTTQSNTAVCKFSIASDGWDKEDTTFVACRSFGKTAEFIEKYFAKGKPIQIVGRLSQWTDEKEKKRHTYVEVVEAAFVPSSGSRSDSETPPDDEKSRYRKPDAGPGADDGDDTPF